MKKVFAILTMIMLAVMPLVLVGCKAKYQDMTIEVESNYEIVLGETENDSITIEARVNGARDENGGKLSFSPDNERLVNISQTYKNKINYITLKGLAPGKVNIEARTLEGGVTKSFTVDIIQPIKGFSARQETLFVAKGQDWSLDIEKNLDLIPTNTTQTNFSVSFAANQDISGLNIVNNVLTVSKDVKLDEVGLVIQSVDNSELPAQEMKLQILDPFVEVNKEDQAEHLDISAGNVLVFEKTQNLDPKIKLEHLDLVSNVVGLSEKNVVIRVCSARETDVEVISSNKLTVKKLSAVESYGANGKVAFTDFTFSVRFSDSVSSGTSTKLGFKVLYKDFDQSLILNDIGVSYELAPKALLVNSQDNLDTFTLYNFYSTAKKGQKLQFGVLPTSVSANNSIVCLVNKTDLRDTFEYIQFFREDGTEIFEGDEILANEAIYARSKTGVVSGEYEIVVQTKYIDPNTGFPLSKTLKFNVLSGMTGLEFVDTTSINLQLNSTTNYVEVLVNVTPANIDISKILVEPVDGLNISTLAHVKTTTDGVTLKFTAKAEKIGKYTLRVMTENGFEATREVKVVSALENVVLSTANSSENSAVGDRELIGGQLHGLAVSVGGSVLLEQRFSPSQSQFKTEFSYVELEKKPDFSLDTYDFPNTITNSSAGVLDYAQLLAYQKIVPLKEGFTVIRAKYTPIGIVANEEAELEPIYRYFYVQGYTPIKSIVMSSNYEELYSLESVGAYNKTRTMTQVSLAIYPENATYAKSIEWIYDATSEYFTFDKETLTVTAKRRSPGIISIIARVTELNRTYSQTLSINIQDAKMVNTIGLIGTPDSIYINNTDGQDKEYRIYATAFPTDAFNTALRYDFVDNSGNVNTQIKIGSDGVMYIPGGMGASGFIRIAAEDCFQEDPLTGQYRPIRGVEGRNMITIPTVIANGLSKDTAIQISSKEELLNIDTTKHYKLTQSIDAQDVSFSNFSGGLYGFDSQNPPVISGLNKTLFEKIEKGAIISDLIIQSDAMLSGQSGLLAGVNEGTIENLTIQGNWGGEMSLVRDNKALINNVNSEVHFDGTTFASIAINNLAGASVLGCRFSGSIKAEKSGAGIVLNNFGSVERCATWLVEGNSISLSTSFDGSQKIAGLVLDNNAGSTITKSYVQSYNATASFNAQDEVCAAGFVHSNNGKITQSFAVLMAEDLITGFVYNNAVDGKINNCYSNTNFVKVNSGRIATSYSVAQDDTLWSLEDCYSADQVTSKGVLAWLETGWDISASYLKETIWKIYLDSQNPFLNGVVASVKPETLTTTVNEAKNSRYIKLSDNQVVLFLYKSKVSPLSVQEKSRLNSLNTYPVYELTTLEVTPLDASTSPDMFRYSLSEGNAMRIEGMSIVVEGLGKQTLTITSILNPDLSYSIDLYSSLPIRDFNIYSSMSSMDPSLAMTEGSIIYIKRSYTQPLYSKVGGELVLVDRAIDYEVFDMLINFSNEESSKKLGLYFLLAESSELKELVCSLNLDQVSPYAEFEEIKSELISRFTKSYEVVVYNGAENLSSSVTSLEMEPIDTLELMVSIKTDYVATETKSQEGGEDLRVVAQDFMPILYQLRNSRGVDASDDFIIEAQIVSINGQTKVLDENDQNKISDLSGLNVELLPKDDKGFSTYEIKLSIKLRDQRGLISGDYELVVTPNEDVTAFNLSPLYIDLKLLPQSLQRIDYSHYYAQATIEKVDESLIEIVKINPQPSNALAPGQVGILELNLFPTYSQIDRVEIISVPIENEIVNLQLYNKREDNNLKEFVIVQQNSEYFRIENGISVGYTMITNGTIYLKTQVSSKVSAEHNFELIVRAYSSKDNANVVEERIFLVAKFIPTANVKVEGKSDYIVMGRGTSKTLDIEVIGEGDVEIYVKNGASTFIGNDGTVQYSTESYKRAYVTSKELVSTQNLGTINRYNYRANIFVGSMFRTDENIFNISVVVSREVNGVRERKESILTVQVLDFVIDAISTVGEENKQQVKVSVNTKLDYSFDIDEPITCTAEIEDEQAVINLKKKIQEFKDGQYNTKILDSSYQKILYYIDSQGQEHQVEINNPKDNGYVEVRLLDNDTITVIKGIKTGTIQMKIKVVGMAQEVELYSLDHTYDVVITNYTTGDKPLAIGSVEDFNAIFEQQDAQDYILTQDIQLSDLSAYTDTSKIRSLDGNGYRIIISSIATPENGSLDVSLFRTVSETTTLKNVVVDYQISQINANSAQYSTITVAGLAINNDGIITNCHVLSTRPDGAASVGGITIPTVAQSTSIQMAGFVLNNSGVISNSRVGGTSVSLANENSNIQDHNLKVFALVGQDQIAGFVLNNSGIIASSFASNITLINKSDFLTLNQTAGFVLNNQSNAKITGSYVRGVESSLGQDIYVEGEGIESTGEVAGFVYNNLSLIRDCYSNIKLYKQSTNTNLAGVRSAGFVYNNGMNSQIISSISMSKVVDDDVSQALFCGVDAQNQINNQGVITYSYYYSPKNKIQSSLVGAESLDSSKIRVTDAYYGYSFTTLSSLDGMWVMTAKGPDLVAANDIAISRRVLESIGEGDYVATYVPGYEYGSANNPILIRSATEFNDIFGNSKEDSINKYFDKATNTAFGNYRIINDIDLSDILVGGTETTTLSSTTATLAKKVDKYGYVQGLGVIEGNSMEISNLDVSLTNTNDIYFGLVGAIKNGAVVKNLDITVKEVSASSVNYVGALAGFVENSKIININVTKANNQSVALVQGRNVVGGVVGAISGTSEMNNVSSQVSAHSTYIDDSSNSKTNKNVVGEDDDSEGTKENNDFYIQVPTAYLPSETSGQNSNVSVAGAVVGAVFAKDLYDPTNMNINNILYAQVQKIKASSRLSVRGKIVGGLIGYVGKTTYVHDAWLAIHEEQSIDAYDNGIAGGAVGVNNGKLSHIRVEHNDVQDYTSEAESLQREIEQNVQNYYTSSSERLTHENMFTSTHSGQTIGGLVGVANGGIIEDSYTKLDVVSDTAQNLGGLVGIAKTQTISITRAFAFGNVQSKNTNRNVYVGGLFGALLTMSKLDVVVGVNYLDKNYYENDLTADPQIISPYVPFNSFAGAVVNVPTTTHVYTLNSVWDKLILKNDKAGVSNAKAVSTSEVNLKNLFPVEKNTRVVNEIFEINETIFNNAFWARNADEVLPHLTFGLEELYFVIDNENTASDIRKILSNTNKTFYIKGEVDIAGSPNRAEILKTINTVRDSVLFTGKLLGMPEDMWGTETYVAAALIGSTQLFSRAVGATFANFEIKNPVVSNKSLPAGINFGGLVGAATDCSFTNIKLSQTSTFSTPLKVNSDSSSNEGAGGLVGAAGGKTSFESINVDGLKMQGTGELGLGLIVGIIESNITMRACQVTNGEITGNAQNIGGFVGLSKQGITIQSQNSERSLLSNLTIDANGAIQTAGGVIGSAETSATLNLVVAQISVNVQISGGNTRVGGLVGNVQENLSISNQMNDIKLSNINVLGAKNAYVGGIVGSAQVLNYEASLGQPNMLKFEPPHAENGSMPEAIRVDAGTIVAGGVVGQISRAVYLNHVFVNTQGQLKNRLMSLTATNVTAGGLVGEFYGADETDTLKSKGNLSIINCVNGTDIDVIKPTLIFYGGIVGSIAKGSKSYDNNSISGNLSYGRFYVNSDTNPEDIYAGGILGSDGIGKASTYVKNNMSLTSLEIKRRAVKSHNVNAIVGTTIKATAEATNHYSYQLSLAVENNTSFASDSGTYGALLGKITGLSSLIRTYVAGEAGSILNPIEINEGSNVSIENNKYYSLTSAVTLEGLDNSDDNSGDKNYVIIGNGNEVSNAHIDTVGERTIVSGVVVTSNEQNEASRTSYITIDNVEIIIPEDAWSKVTINNDPDTKQEINYKTVDNGLVYSVNIDGNSYDITSELTYPIETVDKNGNAIGIISVGEEEYAVTYDDGDSPTQLTLLKSTILSNLKACDEDTQPSTLITNAKEDGQHYFYTTSTPKTYTLYREVSGDVVSHYVMIGDKKVNVENTSSAIMIDGEEYIASIYATGGNGSCGVVTQKNPTTIKTYIYEMEDGNYMDISDVRYSDIEQSDENGVNYTAYYYELTSTIITDISSSQTKLHYVYFGDFSDDKKGIVEGEPTEEGVEVQINFEDYLVKKEADKYYAYNSQIYQTITLATTTYAGTYMIKNGQAIKKQNDEGWTALESPYQITTTYSTGDGANAGASSYGFIQTNNGFVAGVSVRYNYELTGYDHNANLAGFVGINNGAILYSSYNGHYLVEGDKAAVIAGFVASNNGVVDHCFSAGSISGEATNSYSFGANAIKDPKTTGSKTTGSITNSWTITLNETNSTQSIFGDVPTTQNNYYDIKATNKKTEENTNVNGGLDPTYEGDGNGLKTDELWKNNAYSERGDRLLNYGYMIYGGALESASYLNIDCGNGTTTPYLIQNPRMLADLNSNFYGASLKYSLVNNIYMSWYNNFTSIGSSEPYQGTFDGNNYTISKLKIERKEKDYASVVAGGLFASLNGATVRNIKLTDFDITVSNEQETDTACSLNTNYGLAVAGALAGEIQNTTQKELKIENITVNNPTITVTGEHGARAGGMIGQVCSGIKNYTIKDIEVKGSTTISATSSFNDIISRQYVAFISVYGTFEQYSTKAPGFLGIPCYPDTAANDTYIEGRDKIDYKYMFNYGGKFTEKYTHVNAGNYEVTIRGIENSHENVLSENEAFNLAIQYGAFSAAAVGYDESGCMTIGGEVNISKDIVSSSTITDFYQLQWYQDGELAAIKNGRNDGKGGYITGSGNENCFVNTVRDFFSPLIINIEDPREIGDTVDVKSSTMNKTYYNLFSKESDADGINNTLTYENNKSEVKIEYSIKEYRTKDVREIDTAISSEYIVSREYDDWIGQWTYIGAKYSYSYNTNRHWTSYHSYLTNNKTGITRQIGIDLWDHLQVTKNGKTEIIPH